VKTSIKDFEGWNDLLDLQWCLGGPDISVIKEYKITWIKNRKKKQLIPY